MKPTATRKEEFSQQKNATKWCKKTKKEGMKKYNGCRRNVNGAVRKSQVPYIL